MRHFSNVAAFGVLALAPASLSLAGNNVVTELPADTGIYDESSATDSANPQGFRRNAVDRENAGNTKSLADFKADILSAFNNNTGGVVSFDRARGQVWTTPFTPSFGLDQVGSSGRPGNYIGGGFDSTTDPRDTNNGGVVISTYGANQAQSITLSPDDSVTSSGWGQWDIFSKTDSEAFGVGRAISGRGKDLAGVDGEFGAFLTPGTSSVDATFTRLLFTNAPANKGVTEFAFTALSHTQNGPTSPNNTAQTLTVIAYLTDGSTQTRTETMAAGLGVDDVFFHFQAPTNIGFTAFSWDSNLFRPGIDDLAYVVGPVPVPEPTTLAAVASVGMLVLRRRGR